MVMVVGQWRQRCCGGGEGLDDHLSSQRLCSISYKSGKWHIIGGDLLMLVSWSFNIWFCINLLRLCFRLRCAGIFAWSQKCLELKSGHYSPKILDTWIEVDISELFFQYWSVMFKKFFGGFTVKISTLFKIWNLLHQTGPLSQICHI